MSTPRPLSIIARVDSATASYEHERDSVIQRRWTETKFPGGTCIVESRAFGSQKWITEGEVVAPTAAAAAAAHLRP